MFQVKGVIGDLGLSDWWKQTFSKDEQNYIVSKYGEDLVSGNRTVNVSSPAVFLSHLTTWINTKKDYPITLKIVNKAENEYNDNINVDDKHFFFMHMIDFYYKNREISSYFETAIKYCEAQIEIAQEFIRLHTHDYLPSHRGYEQLAIIEEKHKNFARAIHLCLQAKNEGWTGDWDKRIERCFEKAKKNKVEI